MRRRLFSKPLRVAFVLGLALATTAFGQEIDPFYLGLLRSGESAIERQEPARAARDLEVACFGLLDAPEKLASGLALLIVAQGALGDADGVRESFDRLSDLHDRFGTRAADTLSEARFAALQEVLLGYLPSATLSVSQFAELVQERQRQELVGLPPRERESRLQALIAEDPTVLDWSLMLSELRLSTGDPRGALSVLDRIVVDEPQLVPARCLRLKAGAADERCTSVSEDSDQCPEPELDERELRQALLCLEDLGDLEGALSLLSRSDPGVGSSPKISKIARRLESSTTAIQAEALAESRGDADRESMERAREALLTATDPAVLENELESFRRVAERHPDDVAYQRLAGELAYRSSQWPLAAEYLGRAVSGGVSEPDVLFYLSISLYESGDVDSAGTYLRRALPGLQSSPFVEDYAERILGDRRSEGS